MSSQQKTYVQEITNDNDTAVGCNPHEGSSFDAFLEEEGLLEEAEEVAIKRVIAFELDRAMKQRRWSKKAAAEHLGTSRTQLDRLLDPTNTSITLATMTRAARVVGKRVRLTLEDADTAASQPQPASDVDFATELPGTGQN